MKNLIEIVKQIVPMMFIAAIAAVGYALAQFIIVIDFVDKNGNILWRSIFVSIAFFIIGYFIYRAAEKLWSKE